MALASSQGPGEVLGQRLPASCRPRLPRAFFLAMAGGPSRGRWHSDTVGRRVDGQGGCQGPPPAPLVRTGVISSNNRIRGLGVTPPQPWAGVGGASWEGLAGGGKGEESGEGPPSPCSPSGDVRLPQNAPQPRWGSVVGIHPLSCGAQSVHAPLTPS